MPKGRQRGNREAKKPKTAKPSAPATAQRVPAPPMPPAQRGRISDPGTKGPGTRT